MTGRSIQDSDVKFRHDVLERLRVLEREVVSNSGPGASGSDVNFVHIQGTAAAVWNINHNLNKFPSVTVVDSAGTQILTTIEFPDANNIRVKFAGVTSGRAYLN